ncbi:hypothetical protein [Flindersiella endophytica]
MASVVDRPTTGISRLLVDSGEARQWVSSRTDLVTALLSVWFGLGLMIDAWAHSNLSQLETFFTPWHAAFYSGFAAVSGWVLWQVWTRVRAGRRGLAAVPMGYGAALIAIPAFGAFGVVDMTWHTVLGIETTINILFSPSHLGLVVSMLVIVTTPLRSAWNAPDLCTSGVTTAPSFRRMLPALLGIAFAQTLVSLFLSYGSALEWGPRGIVWAFSLVEGGPGDAEGGAGTLAASLVITTLLLFTPLLLLARRWRMPFGTATVIFSVAILMAGAQTAFENLPTLLGIVAAGLVIDAMALWLRPTANRRYAYWAYAGLGSLATWALYIGIASAVAGSLPAVPELWTGAPIVSALLTLVLAVVLLPNSMTVQPTEPSPLREGKTATSSEPENPVSA